MSSNRTADKQFRSQPLGRYSRRICHASCVCHARPVPRRGTSARRYEISDFGACGRGRYTLEHSHGCLRAMCVATGMLAKAECVGRYVLAKARSFTTGKTRIEQLAGGHWETILPPGHRRSGDLARWRMRLAGPNGQVLRVYIISGNQIPSMVFLCSETRASGVILW